MKVIYIYIYIVEKYIQLYIVYDIHGRGPSIEKPCSGRAEYSL